MTAKRFENRLNKDNVKFNTLNPVWDNEKQDALNVFEMIDLLNELHEENMMLKGEVAHYKLILLSLEEQAKRLSRIHCLGDKE